MKQRRLSVDEIKKLCNLWCSGFYTVMQLSDYFGISDVAIRGLLTRRGYKMRSASEAHRQYPLKEDFFDIINTEEKAYILGLLYADGYNNVDRGYINLGLKEDDRQILDIIRDLIQPTRPLKYYDQKQRKNKPKGFENVKSTYMLTFHSKYMSRKLAELGCGQAKTFKIVFPSTEQVPTYLHNHFIRGYIDGDGWIGKDVIKIEGTENFCLSLSDIFVKNFGVSFSIRKRWKESENNIRSLEINGRRQVAKILDWCYEKGSIFMDRKYKAACDILTFVDTVPYKRKEKISLY